MPQTPTKMTANSSRIPDQVWTPQTTKAFSYALGLNSLSDPLDCREPLDSSLLSPSILSPKQSTPTQVASPQEIPQQVTSADLESSRVTGSNLGDIFDEDSDFYACSGSISSSSTSSDEELSDAELGNYFDFDLSGHDLDLDEQNTDVLNLRVSSLNDKHLRSSDINQSMVSNKRKKLDSSSNTSFKTSRSGRQYRPASVYSPT